MRLSTGSKEINELTKGYKINELNLIYGEPATGKTTLALLASITQAKHNKKVIYIDTENGFNLQRITQLYPEINNIIDNIIVLKPKNFEEQEKFILNLPKNNIALIIIDTLGNFYRLKLQEDQYQANKSIDNQLKYLKHLQIPTIIINQVYSRMDGTVNCVGGDMIRNLCKNQILLKKDPRTLHYNKQFLKFKITNEGIEKD